MYLAYTYLITHKITGEYYYGFRCGNITHRRTPEEDLWIKYFTSSKKIKSLIKQYGADSFDCNILLKDSNKENCYIYEQELISKNINDEKCLNQYCNLNGIWSRAGTIHSEETKEKIRIARAAQPATMAGKHHSGITKAKLSKAQTGRSSARKGTTVSDITLERMKIVHTGKQASDATKEKMRMTHTGKRMSEETKAKISASRTGKHYPKEKQ
jgi:hypothetical protein